MEELIQIPQLTKADIKSELISLIAQKWQVNESEVLQRFDPLLMLLIDVVATSYYKVHHLWGATYSNVLQQIISKYLPKYQQQVTPYSVVMQASVTDKEAVITPKTTIRCQASATKGAEAYLSPLVTTTLKQVQLNTMKPLPSTANGYTHKCIWIVTNEGHLNNLHHLPLRIAIENSEHAAQCKYAWKYAALKINGVECQLKSGLPHAAKKNSYEEAVFSCYKDDFFYVHCPADLPPASESLLSSYDLSHDSSSVFLFEWEFPMVMRNEWFRYVHVQLNAFIAINRQILSVNHKIVSWMNVVPLPIDGSLLSLMSIVNEREQYYEQAQLSMGSVMEPGTFLLKSANHNNGDGFQLKYQLEEIQQMIHQQSAYYDLVSNDFLSAQFQEVQKIVYRIDEKLRDAKPINSQVNYVSLKPFHDDKNVTISYAVHHPNSSKIVTRQAHFSVQGSSIPQGGLSLLTLPYVPYVATANTPTKIRSKYDVTCLCEQIFQQDFLNLHIERSWMANMDSLSQSGMQLNIYIYLSENYNTEKLEMHQSRLSFLLAEYSAFTYPYALHILSK